MSTKAGLHPAAAHEFHKRHLGFNQSCAAGYLVKYSGVQPESITLSMLTEPEKAMNFIDWRIEQQSKFTAFVHKDIAPPRSFFTELEFASAKLLRSIFVNVNAKLSKSFSSMVGKLARIQ